VGVAEVFPAWAEQEVERWIREQLLYWQIPQPVCLRHLLLADYGYDSQGRRGYRLYYRGIPLGELFLTSTQDARFSTC
jgi:hypothetical protein